MTRSDDLYQLPPDLPVPVDDGACRHLRGMRVPKVVLASTSGAMVDLSVPAGRIVVYCYPRTGRPDQDPVAGWNEFPGARGCTPQSCGFRDQYERLRRLGAHVYGLSTQDTAYQSEAVERLHLPFALLSDEKLAFARALKLPTFDIGGMTLIKRLTLIICSGFIEQVLYPVFPPDRSAAEVVRWLAKVDR